MAERRAYHKSTNKDSLESSLIFNSDRAKLKIKFKIFILVPVHHILVVGQNDVCASSFLAVAINAPMQSDLSSIHRNHLT